MATRKRPLCFDAHATHKRLKLEHATLKRFREEDSGFVMNKRTKCMTVQSELHDLKNDKHNSASGIVIDTLHSGQASIFLHRWSRS